MATAAHTPPTTPPTTPATRPSAGTAFRHPATGEIYVVYTPLYPRQVAQGHEHGLFYFRPLARTFGPPVSLGYATAAEARAAALAGGGAEE